MVTDVVAPFAVVLGKEWLPPVPLPVVPAGCPASALEFRFKEAAEAIEPSAGRTGSLAQADISKQASRLIPRRRSVRILTFIPSSFQASQSPLAMAWPIDSISSPSWGQYMSPSGSSRISSPIFPKSSTSAGNV